jgi:hypothetical protein
MRESQRRNLLFGILALVLAIGVWQWGLSSLLKTRDNLNTRVASSEKLLTQMYTLEKAYAQERRSSRGALHKLGSKDNFNLFAFLEELADKDGIRNAIDAMSPRSRAVNNTLREELVEMRLRNVHIDDLVPYLYHIEHTTQPIRILKFRVKSYPQKPLDVDMVVATYIIQ